MTAHGWRTMLTAHNGTMNVITNQSDVAREILSAREVHNKASARQTHSICRRIS